MKIAETARRSKRSKIKTSTNGHAGREISSHEDFLRQLVTTLDAADRGDFSARLPVTWTNLEGRAAEKFNSIISQMQRFNDSLTRLRRQAGEEGKIHVRLPLGDAVGDWSERIEAVNSLVDEL